MANVRRAVSDETTYQVPQTEKLELPLLVPEPVSEEAVEQPSSTVSQGQRAESMESLLSLSDVEFGMEEHVGDFDETDRPRRRVKRRVSIVFSSLLT